MTEAHFWLSLEYRVTREFAGLADRHWRYFWCDGFLPRDYLLDGPEPQITGTCWICNGPRQDEWKFSLRLPPSVKTPADIDWSALLPAEDQTHWMALDTDRRFLELTPLSATPEPDGQHAPFQQQPD